MTLKELSLFYHLCEETHLCNLSKKLGITQSAISLAIQSLEKKIGEPLFDRIGKKLVLSEKGRLFYEKTYPHFEALKEAQLFFSHNALAGSLKIASSKTIGEYLMPSIIYDFRLSHPNVNIHKTIQNSASIIEMLKNGEIDMGFIESSCEFKEICKEVIAYDELIVVSSDKTLQNARCYIDELFDKKWILREKGSGTREVFLEALGESAKALPLFLEFSEFEEAKTLLLRYQNAITCLSRVVVEKELERNELFEVNLKNISLKRPFYLIYHKDKYASKLFSEFKRFVLDASSDRQ
ncbi:MAG: LysR family transcriptional regulator [Epsilonproteobacteria bacterium]|nr:LysR family transcriptional regulator [Campylobacterota bacterium]